MESVLVIQPWAQSLGMVLKVGGDRCGHSTQRFGNDSVPSIDVPIRMVEDRLHLWHIFVFNYFRIWFTVNP